MAAKKVREVRIPEGWAGLSFKRRDDGRFFITEIPKLCFSTASFGASAPKQVEGVHEGDEVVTINGETPQRLAERIMCSGDELNACSSASPPHAVGAIGKLDSPPCHSCDFARRQKSIGLDASIMLWIKAVKRDNSITLGLHTFCEAAAETHRSPKLILKPRECSSQAGIVTSANSSGKCAMSDLKSLNYVAWEQRSTVKLTPRLDPPPPVEHVSLREPSQVLTPEKEEDILAVAANLPQAGKFVKLLSWDLDVMEQQSENSLQSESQFEVKLVAKSSVMPINREMHLTSAPRPTAQSSERRRSSRSRESKHQELEAFIKKNGRWLPKEAEDALRAINLLAQDRVISAGTMEGCRDPVAVIKARANRPLSHQKNHLRHGRTFTSKASHGQELSGTLSNYGKSDVDVGRRAPRGSNATRSPIARRR